MTASTKPSIPIWGARHVAIRVRDLDAAKRWYTDILSMTIADEFPGRGFFVRFGDFYHHDLAIFKADPEAPAPAPNSVGLAHIALLVDSLDGVKEWYHHLKANGVNISNATDHGVTRSIYFTDPDGNPFEIYCDNPDFNWRKDGLLKIDPLDVGEPQLIQESNVEEVTRDGKLLLIKIGPLGDFANNAYVIADSTTNDAVIIDAPAESGKAVAAAKGLNVRQIIVTHQHRDHWGGIDELLAGIDAPVFTHAEDSAPHAQYVNGTLADGDEVTVGGITLNIIHTPGHTPGSICLRLGEHLISGDTLFPGGPGRTRTPELLAQEIASITSRLHTLPDSLHVYPGHGANTTIAESKAEYAVFASKPHDPALSGDVLWLTS